MKRFIALMKQAGMNPGLMGVAVSVAVFVLVLRSIARPLAELRRGTRAVAGGDLDHQLERTHTDEFSELADDFTLHAMPDACVNLLFN